MSSGRKACTIFFDTSAFIPLLDTGRDLNARLVNHIKERNALVGIDTVVLSEYLVGIADPELRKSAIENFTKQFRVYSIDVQTAVVCAELFRVLKAKGEIPVSREERQLKKVDILVMASAIVSGASEVVYEDRDFSRYAPMFPSSVCGYTLPTFVRARDIPASLIQDEFLTDN